MRRDGGGREKEEKGVWSVGERGQSGDESTSQTSLQSLAASSVSAKIDQSRSLLNNQSTHG